MTQRDVSYVRLNSRGDRNTYYTNKRQGLNLETEKGFHLIDSGLPGDIVPSAFKKVGLEYPIIVNQSEDVPAAIHQLKLDLAKNLFYIYDPFSWKARGNTRFKKNFRGEIDEVLKRERFKVTDIKWFHHVFSQLIADAAFIKHVGADDIYENQILSRIPQTKNQLGIDLDLLNWHKKEKRSIDYEPATEIKIPYINFDRAYSVCTAL